MTADITERRLDEWLDWAQSNRRRLRFKLRAPASEEKLAELESLIGSALPFDLKAMYRRFDGEEQDSFGLFYGHPVMSVDEVIGEVVNCIDRIDAGLIDPLVDTYSSLPPGMATTSPVSASQVPVVKDYGGNFLGVDLSPPAAGSWGQVTTFGSDDFVRLQVSPSWSAMIGWLLEALQDGLFLGDSVLEDFRGYSAFHEEAMGLSKAEADEVFEDMSADIGPWDAIGFVENHFHDAVRRYMLSGRRCVPRAPVAPFDNFGPALRAASPPSWPDPSRPDGIDAGAGRPWRRRPVPRAQRPPFQPDGTLDAKVSGLVELVRDLVRNRRQWPAVLIANGTRGATSTVICVKTGENVFQQVSVEDHFTLGRAVGEVFGALGYTDYYLPRRPGGATFGSFSIIVEASRHSFTPVDPDRIDDAERQFGAQVEQQLEEIMGSDVELIRAEW